MISTVGISGVGKEVTLDVPRLHAAHINNHIKQNALIFIGCKALFCADNYEGILL